MAVDEHIEADLRELQSRIRRYADEHDIPESERNGKTAQVAYQNDPNVKVLADQILADTMPMVKIILNTPDIRRLHKEKNTLFSREELETIGAVGIFGAKGNTYGGLLGAILRADDEKYNYLQFKQFAFDKIHGAIIDHVRNTLHRNKNGKERPQTTSIEQLKENFGSGYEPNGHYFGNYDHTIIAGQDIRNLEHAARQLKEPHKAIILELLDSIAEIGNAEEALARTKNGSPLHDKSYPNKFEEALTALKFAYCQLDDDRLPNAIVAARADIKNAKDVGELAKKVHDFRNAFGLRLWELGISEGVSASRMSQKEAANQISGSLLAHLGLGGARLPAFAIPLFPECWTEQHLDQKKQSLIDTEDFQKFSQTLKDIFQAELFHHPDHVRQHCGAHNEKIIHCLRSLGEDKVTPSLQVIEELKIMLNACGMEEHSESIAMRVIGVAALNGNEAQSSNPAACLPKDIPVAIIDSMIEAYQAGSPRQATPAEFTVFRVMSDTERRRCIEYVIDKATDPAISFGLAFRLLRIVSGKSSTQLAEIASDHALKHIELNQQSEEVALRRFLDRNPLELPPEGLAFLRAKSGYIFPTPHLKEVTLEAVRHMVEEYKTGNLRRDDLPKPGEILKKLIFGKLQMRVDRLGNPNNINLKEFTRRIHKNSRIPLETLRDWCHQAGLNDEETALIEQLPQPGEKAPSTPKDIVIDQTSDNQREQPPRSRKKAPTTPKDIITERASKKKPKAEREELKLLQWMVQCRLPLSEEDHQRLADLQRNNSPQGRK